MFYKRTLSGAIYVATHVFLMHLGTVQISFAVFQSRMYVRNSGEIHRLCET